LRAVTTATAATALGIKRKALDNLIGRLESSDLPRGRQGVERRIPISMLANLFLTLELTSRLGATAREAFVVAQRLSAGQDVSLGPFIRIEADLPAIQSELEAQLEIAIESVVRRPRGRPSRS
jgi:hypothetical protein